MKDKLHDKSGDIEALVGLLYNALSNSNFRRCVYGSLSQGRGGQYKKPGQSKINKNRKRNKSQRASRKRNRK